MQPLVNSIKAFLGIFETLSFNSIFDKFNNSKIRNLRKKHLENKLDGTICKNCIYNTNEDYEIIDKEINKNIKLNPEKIVNRKISNINNRMTEHIKKMQN